MLIPVAMKALLLMISVKERANTIMLTGLPIKENFAMVNQMVLASLHIVMGGVTPVSFLMVNQWMHP